MKKRFFYLTFAVTLIGQLTAYPIHSYSQSGTNLLLITESPQTNSIETPSFFKTSIDTKRPENRLKSTDEIISQTVGVDVDNFGGLGKLSTISIRGSSSNQVIILLDGTKLNSPSNQAVDLSSLSLNSAEKIEILRGGSSAEYGDGAIGGIINIIPSTDDETNKRALNLNVGSFNTTSLAFFAKGHAKKLNYILSSSFAKSDGDFRFTNPNNTPNNPNDDYNDTRENNGYNTFGIFAKGNFKSSERFKTSIANEFYYSGRGIPGNLYFPSLNANENNLRNVTNLDFYLKDFLPKGDLKITLFNNLEKLSFKDPKGELTGTSLATDEISYNSGLNLLFDIFPTHSNLVTISTGSEFNFLDQTLGKSTNQKPFRVTTHVALKDQLSLLRSRIVISPILRLDCIYNDNNDLSDTDFVLTPKIGLLSKLSDNLQLKTNLGSSFRYPSFNELYFNEGFIEGNSNLKTEKAINFDIGLRIFRNAYFLEFAYFLNSISDLIVYEQISNFRYKPINIGESIVQGFELSGGINPVSFLKIIFNNTFLDPRNYTNDPNKRGKLIPGKPVSKTNLRVSLLGKEKEVFTEFQAISSNFVNEANTVKLGARYILNCGFSLTYMEATFNIELKNTLNNQIEDVRGFPLPGRSFMTGVTLKI